jgi:molybdopterin synthase catalytic subunit
VLTTEPLRFTDPPIDSENGAVLTFVGVVRSQNRGRRVSAIDYQAYAGMAEREIDRLGDEARSRFGLSRVSVIHRVGVVPVGEASLMIALTSAHRGPALEAMEWIVSEIKRRVPIWKKEHYDDDTAEWV